MKVRYSFFFANISFILMRGQKGMTMDELHVDWEKFDKETSNAKYNVHIPTVDELVDPEEEKRNKRNRIICTVVGVVTGTIAAVLVGNRKQK